MCDYSLYEFPNRLAREGEELVTYRFPSGCLGLASPADLERLEDMPSGRGLWSALRSLFRVSAYRLSHPSSVCAVCVPPGARLILRDTSAEMQKRLSVCPEEGGKFIETSAEPDRHRDAIQFANGRVILLQYLRVGQRVEILSLVASDEFGEERQRALVR
jgi:hypothetical protein